MSWPSWEKDRKGAESEEFDVVSLLSLKRSCDAVTGLLFTVLFVGGFWSLCFGGDLDLDFDRSRLVGDGSDPSDTCRHRRVALARLSASPCDSSSLSLLCCSSSLRVHRS